MKNNIIYYSVGALLYCPANKVGIANAIIRESFGNKFSLALCLEDTINDAYVYEAEQILIRSLNEIYTHHETHDFYLPKIFIRVREPAQISRLAFAMKSCISIITGFIIPKFSDTNAESYIHEIIKVNEQMNKRLYAMPIYESSHIIDLNQRTELLYKLKDLLAPIEELVLNIRVGGNDLCHAFGFRRHSDESIHQIQPVANIFYDLITVYAREYVISGPVWEYYSGEQWKKGMEQELHDDKLCGFIGKTVIHPNQIEVVNHAYRIPRTDYQDALAILNWNKETHSFVSGNESKERMNEYKTHTNWAEKIIYLAEMYGIED